MGGKSIRFHDHREVIANESGIPRLNNGGVLGLVNGRSQGRVNINGIVEGGLGEGGKIRTHPPIVSHAVTTAARRVISRT